MDQKVEKKEESGFVPKIVFGDENVHVLYGSQKGRSRNFADVLANRALEFGLKAKVYPLDKYDFDSLVGTERWIVFVVSTYTDGVPPDNAKIFYDSIVDSVNDFRVPRSLLEGTTFAIFGCGNKSYGKNFNKVARNIYNHLKSLRARSLVPLGLGNDEEDIDDQFEKWNKNFWRALKRDQERKQGQIDELREKQKALNDLQEESISDDDEPEPVIDVEDLGLEIDESESLPLDLLTREMITPQVRKELTKQGYKLLGSHSGVKLCRWTKSMLRGRGGCYKHTFYGITSYQCMEMTTSLACANKCVFCWRHHSNPVSKSWKWKVDDPEFLIKAAIENHKQLIKSMKGVPGVVQERYEEALSNIKHCALSLVGEPIIYPYINDFIDLLHKHKISTFLVTNAQFPEKNRNITTSNSTLYIS